MIFFLSTWGSVCDHEMLALLLRIKSLWLPLDLHRRSSPTLDCPICWLGFFFCCNWGLSFSSHFYLALLLFVICHSFGQFFHLQFMKKWKLSSFFFFTLNLSCYLDLILSICMHAMITYLNLFGYFFLFLYLLYFVLISN